jgi:tetratricopeptide (TPR) repeat protein
MASALVEAGVQVYRSQIELTTYPWWPAIQHPYFRGTDGVNIYPYPMLDQLSRTKTSRTWRTVVMENEYLRVTFLPELGGKVHEVIDKSTGQSMFYVNHAVKPGLIGQCGAWVSGGIEFNTGPQGHTVSAVQPVDVVILPPAADGSRTVAVGEVERIYRTRWTAQVTLRPGRSYLEETIRIYNRTETVRPYYFWNCTAVPNNPGFRFIYPMTLGTDHGGNEFYSWPIANGKDLSRGTNYQDASSIFAYQCDQDFFGSYDDSTDRGIVAYANHFVLPGKKAWTWGQGGFGRMHQMDLTDQDGPYNEVQTGPLPTQADVGRLDPLEAVQWREWWYPIHGLGGFTFANRDLAIQASTTNGHLCVRLLGTANWSTAKLRVTKEAKAVASANIKISPRDVTRLELDLAGTTEPLQIEIIAGKETLAEFRLPLDLPARQPPTKKTSPNTAAELVQAGWQDYLFARYNEAEKSFRQALEKDAQCAEAQTGLAYLDRDRNPTNAMMAARSAVSANPDNGLAWLILADLERQIGNESLALDNAWKAALDPVTAIPARALVALLLLRRGDWDATIAALSSPGPWQSDPVARNRLALAFSQKGNRRIATQLARETLALDPLDAFARSILWLIDEGEKGWELKTLVHGAPQPLLELATEYQVLNQDRIALRLLDEFYLRASSRSPQEPMVLYYAAWLSSRVGQMTQAESLLRQARSQPAEGVFPHRPECIPALRWALETNPQDGQSALYLGHLMFSMGRHAEGRSLWRQAASHGAALSLAWRALGMASLNLDNDQQAALDWLRKAHEHDRQDAIVARDLARILFQQADKTENDETKRALWGQIRTLLQSAFDAGKGRSDFVALLARALNRLGEFSETARLLDSVRITIWEGAREAHDLFEESHLALGQKHLEAGRAAEALAEFNRALEYPENLATGRLENAREAHIHFLRGNALSALGKTQAAREAWRLAADEPASKDPKKDEARKQAQSALDKLDKNGT